jgi:hypothetical protein
MRCGGALDSATGGEPHQLIERYVCCDDGNVALRRDRTRVGNLVVLHGLHSLGLQQGIFVPGQATPRRISLR